MDNNSFLLQLVGTDVGTVGVDVGVNVGVNQIKLQSNTLVIVGTNVCRISATDN